MFRHTTKVRRENQLTLSRQANRKASDEDSVPCPTILDQPFCRSLPPVSVDLLKAACEALCGRNVTISPSRRLTHSIATWYNGEADLRCTFLTPEVVTVAATVPTWMKSELWAAFRELAEEFSYDSVQIWTSKRSCRVLGRLTPYILDRTGCTDYELTHVNITRTRIVFLLNTPESSSMYFTTRDTWSLLSSWTGELGSITWIPNDNNFKVLAGNHKETSTPNKSTCAIVYPDGRIRIQGLPADVPKVCAVLNTAINRISKSSGWEPFLVTLKKGTTI